MESKEAMRETVTMLRKLMDTMPPSVTDGPGMAEAKEKLEQMELMLAVIDLPDTVAAIERRLKALEETVNS